jgi:polysaccharide biosynthesis/export protein
LNSRSLHSGSGANMPLCRTFVMCVMMMVFGTRAHASDDVAAGAAEYRVSAEDVLHIAVWKEEGLEQDAIVRPDGGISFPLAGDIQAAGLTPKEIEADIARRLQRYIPDAVVTVSVIKVQGLRIYVTGKVKTPGQYTVGRYVDVLQALTLAGGLTPYANDGDIKVLRRENGKEVVYKFNYGDVRNGKHLDQNITLQTDDVVVVP